MQQAQSISVPLTLSNAHREAHTQSIQHHSPDSPADTPKHRHTP